MGKQFELKLDNPNLIQKEEKSIDFTDIDPKIVEETIENLLKDYKTPQRRALEVAKNTFIAKVYAFVYGRCLEIKGFTLRDKTEEILFKIKTEGKIIKKLEELGFEVDKEASHLALFGSPKDIEEDHSHRTHGDVTHEEEMKKDGNPEVEWVNGVLQKK